MENTGNENAGRPLATLSQIPGHHKRLQREWDVDAIKRYRQRNIKWSRGSEEMSQSCICQPCHQATPEVEIEQVVYFQSLPGIQSVVRYWLPSSGRRNGLQSYGPEMVAWVSDATWLSPWQGWPRSCQLTSYRLAYSTNCQPWNTRTTSIARLDQDASTSIPRSKQDASTSIPW